jgi:hypothetical protein
MLETVDEIKENTEYFVAVISRNDQIDSTFLVPVPARTGLDGNSSSRKCAT